MITLRCYDSFFRPLGEIANFVDADGPSLEYVLTCAPGTIGAMVLTVPATTSLDLFPKDGLLVPYRSIAGRPPAMDNGAVYLVRKREAYATHTRITALHATSLLQRRIIDYRSGLNPSSGANYTGKGPAPADDVIVDYVTQNLGSSAASAQPEASGRSSTKVCAKAKGAPGLSRWQKRREGGLASRPRASRAPSPPAKIRLPEPQPTSTSTPPAGTGNRARSRVSLLRCQKRCSRGPVCRARYW